jgi:hypothetical protein
MARTLTRSGSVACSRATHFCAALKAITIRMLKTRSTRALYPQRAAATTVTWEEGEEGGEFKARLQTHVSGLGTQDAGKRCVLHQPCEEGSLSS